MAPTGRTWPAPQSPWIMAQTWHELLFAHWPVPLEALREVVPPSLPIDTFEKEAWIGVIPFTMTGVRARWLPPFPGLSAFHEINVRTYVTLEGKPGVYFFSLDASSSLAVAMARRFYRLPYFKARMSLKRAGGRLLYHSRRRDRLSSPAEFAASYQPVGVEFTAPEGSLEAFLTSRYALYTVHQGRVYRGEIVHPPWRLQRAALDVQTNTMTSPLALSPPKTNPHLLYARRMDVVVWPLERLRS